MSVYDDYQDYKRYKIILPYMKIQDIEQIRSYIDCYRFYSLSLQQLEKLMEYGFVTEYRENGYDENVTTLKEVIEVLKQYPKLRLAGYIINNKRQDARITIEALNLTDKTALPAIEKLGLLPDTESFEEMEKRDKNGTLDEITWWHIIVP